MNIFMIGGTGLLGCEAALSLIKKGHNVTSVALAPLPEGAPIPEEMEISFGDINKKSDDEIEALLDGKDAFVFAAGIDERVDFPSPVFEYYYKYNIEPLERLLPLCKKAGIKKAVVLGSYFSYLAKTRPEMKFDKKSPYIKSRLLQEEVCRSYADDNFSVAVLELPYIFGTQPGRKPVWTILIEQIAFMDRWPFTLYPKGGTAMLTCKQVGQAVAGAVERQKTGYEAIPISMYNLKWKQFLSVVYEARGMSKNRRIVGISAAAMKLGMIKTVVLYKKKKIDAGLKPFDVADILDLDLFISNSYCKALGVVDDDINAAIADSIRLSEEVYKGSVKLLDMKGE